MTTESEIAWAAGFFDGEGSTQFQRKGKGRSPLLRLMVMQMDNRPLVRLNAALGLGRLYGPYASQKGIHVWAASGYMAEEALLAMWFHLSEPKREQAMIAWRKWRDRPQKRRSWAEIGRTERNGT